MIEVHKNEVERLTEEARKYVATAKRIFDRANALLSNDDRTAEEEEIHGLIMEWTMEQLDAEIESDKNKLEMIHGGNPHAIRDYEKRKEQIERLRAKIVGLESDIAGMQAKIKEVQDEWEPQLDHLIQEISNNFAHNFEKIGCAGQVSVYKDDDFAEWSVQIQVKFR
jgi:structural maintenance of chromosomes protein 5